MLQSQTMVDITIKLKKMCDKKCEIITKGFWSPQSDTNGLAKRIQHQGASFIVTTNSFAEICYTNEQEKLANYEIHLKNPWPVNMQSWGSLLFHILYVSATEEI